VISIHRAHLLLATVHKPPIARHATDSQSRFKHRAPVARRLGFPVPCPYCLLLRPVSSFQQSRKLYAPATEGGSHTVSMGSAISVCAHIGVHISAASCFGTPNRIGPAD
jgi:hypothetical protein